MESIIICMYAYDYRLMMHQMLACSSMATAIYVCVYSAFLFLYISYIRSMHWPWYLRRWHFTDITTTVATSSMLATHDTAAITDEARTANIWINAQTKAYIRHSTAILYVSQPSSWIQQASPVFYRLAIHFKLYKNHIICIYMHKLL